jgi:hypothetical protein
VTKADVRAAVDATDAWIDSASAAAAPPHRIQLGAAAAVPRRRQDSDQKTLLFCYVAMRRAGLLKTEAD